MIARSRWADALLALLATLVASWAVGPLVQGRAWVGPMILGLLAVTAVGVAGRAVRLPAPLVLLAQAGAGWTVLSWVFVPGNHWAGLPLGSALTDAAALVRQGSEAIRVESVPAPGSPGLLLVVAGSMVAVGLAVDLIGVTLRSPALAGLPLLVVLAVTASGTGQPLSPRYFLTTAAVWLALVARQSITAVRTWPNHHSWSRTVPVPADGEDDAGRTGRRHRAWAASLGAVTVALAVVLPGSLPHLAPTALIQGLGTAPGRAAGGVTFTDTLDLSADLADRSDRPVLRYRADGARPTPLRVLVTSRYANGRWWPVAGQGGPPAPPLVPSEPVVVAMEDLELTVVDNNLDAPQVALPYPLASADFGDIAARTDPRTGTVSVAARPSSYEAVSPQITGTLPAGAGDPPLREAVAPELLQVDPAAAPALREVLADVAAEETNQLRIARAIQSYLRGPDFTYSLTLAEPVQGPDGRPLDPVTHFLTTRLGYCTQFASAMVLLAREAGIPARLAVGFLPGERELDGSYTVVAADAHAWPELYIAGLGWTRFEPTPAGRSGAAPVYLTQSDVGAPVPTAGPATPPTGERPVMDPGGAVDGPGAPASNWMEGTVRALGRATGILAVVAAAVLIVPLAGRWRREAGRRRARDDSSHVEAEWQLLAATLSDLGLPAPVGATPRQAAEHYRSAAGLSGDAADALARAAARLERARYAPGGADPGTMARDVRDVTRRVRATRSWRARLGAVLWPASGVEQLRAWGDRLGAMGRARSLRPRV
ncbi:DUF3488 and transglutaminase-like domain-containing protein [Georgenia sp. EYE_87]|uniref:transglutaminase family protein n=1 Tax=Georgenia sp. EYE_87 TaxID=2853448 RepID=UPI0020030649|nr:DUF3488 and transglutaminase-like domain-containing protein [Georgenia sp. EYE_87]MCK6209112.1 DUF3488 and transglutaminase-like domain-containing protein [Georgenia sp. EYE_87]